MQLDVTGHHVEITEALRSYVTSKLDKVGRHFDLVQDAHCVLTVEKLRHRAETTINVSGGKIHAEATEEDMYAAIDSMADKIERRVRKHKEKTVDHRAREADKRNFE